MAKFNPPPGWDVPPYPWAPPSGFTQDPSWPDAPAGWSFWVAETEEDEWVKGGTGNSGDAGAKTALSREEIEDEIRASLLITDDRLLLQEAGIYEYHHPLENAVDFEVKLEDIRLKIKALISGNSAISFSSKFVFENSLAKGEKFAKDLAAIALYAFNQEVENTLRLLKAGTLDMAKKRIMQSAEKLSRLGRLTDLRLSEAFVSLRLEELELTADYLQKKDEEKLAAREERARLREEQKASQELQAEKVKLEKEKAHYLNALEIVSAAHDFEQVKLLESRLLEIEMAIERNDYRINNVRAGYVYVISNEGAFGPGVVKIGMTRRLDPMDRVVELGDASVPFRFSVHALFFSDDAVGLEANLHSYFGGRRLNKVNLRKEFFFAAPLEVREYLKDHTASLLEFDALAINEEYLQSLTDWDQGRHRSR